MYIFFIPILENGEWYDIWKAIWKQAKFVHVIYKI